MTSPENAAFLAAQSLHNVKQRTAELNATQRAWERAIVDARTRGVTVRAIAESAGISPQSVLNVCARFNVTDG